MGDNPDMYVIECRSRLLGSIVHFFALAVRRFGVAEDVMEIATGVASVVKSSYKAAKEKEHLRQISTSKQVLQVKVKNKTNYMWTMPKLYFARGEATDGPAMTIMPKGTLDWMAASHPMVNGLDAVLTYDIIQSSSDTENSKLVVLFSVSGGGSRKSGWKAEVGAMYWQN